MAHLDRKQATMRMPWNKPPRAPARRPTHHDPAVELRIQQIESHHAIIAGQHVQIETYRAEIIQRLDQARRLRYAAGSDHYNYNAKVNQAQALEASVSVLEGQIRQLEDAIVGQHEAITNLSDGLDEAALWLLFPS